MRRTILACVAAVAVLGAGAIAGIWWASREPAGGASAGGRASGEAAHRAGAPAAPPEEPPPARAGGSAREAPLVGAPNPPRAQPRPRRLSARHAARIDASRGAAPAPTVWEVLRARIAPCLEGGRARPVATSSGPPRPDGPAVLLVDVELRGGDLEIVAVSPQGGSRADDPATRCAVEALRGQRVAGGGGSGDDGTRVQIPLRLFP